MCSSLKHFFTLFHRLFLLQLFLCVDDDEYLIT
ncbi:hypothetical protein CsSME_00030384 [Camellia sinensis var. sinensis]